MDTGQYVVFFSFFFHLVAIVHGARRIPQAVLDCLFLDVACHAMCLANQVPQSLTRVSGHYGETTLDARRANATRVGTCSCF